MSFVRQSKFRHIFGSPLKSELCYNGIKVEGTGDTNGAVSGKFIAIIKGSKIFIVPLERTGRQEENSIPFLDCKNKVLDVQWSPFNDSLLASGEETGDINIWVIPDGGLKDSTLEPYSELHNVHTRKVTSVQWHPSADCILAASGADNFVSVWNAMDGSATICRVSDVGSMPTNIAWNYDGSILGITSKSDENRSMSVMLVDPRTGEVMKKEDNIYEGTKPVKLCFLNNGNIMTVGCDKQATRSLMILDKDSLQEKVELELDQGSAALNMHYDTDLKILYLFAKGDSTVKYFEVDEANSKIFYLSSYSSSVSQKGGNFMPKRCMNTTTCEIARFYKFQPTKCEPINFIVPRKSDHFQGDIYPNCHSIEAALSADDWISGKNHAPLKIAFSDILVTKKDSKQPPVAKGGVKKAVPKAVPSSAPSTNNAVPEGVDLTELLEDMKKVKATVRKLNKRVTKLEEMLEQKGGDGNQEEEEE